MDNHGLFKKKAKTSQLIALVHMRLLFYLPKSIGFDIINM